MLSRRDFINQMEPPSAPPLPLSGILSALYPIPPEPLAFSLQLSLICHTDAKGNHFLEMSLSWAQFHTVASGRRQPGSDLTQANMESADMAQKTLSHDDPPAVLTSN